MTVGATIVVIVVVAAWFARPVMLPLPRLIRAAVVLRRVDVAVIGASLGSSLLVAGTILKSLVSMVKLVRLELSPALKTQSFNSLLILD